LNFKYKFVAVVRKDLVMSPAKLGVQIAHAAVGCCKLVRRTDLELYVNEIENYPKFQMFPQGLLNIRTREDEWFDEGQVKLVLQVPTESDLRNISAKCILNNIPHYEVRDFGLTELEPNTFTCVGVGPDLVENVNKITGSLKLWK
jgi:PTH2 family peptidyl-tRNA hydrolase